MPAVAMTAQLPTSPCHEVVRQVLLEVRHVVLRLLQLQLTQLQVDGRAVRLRLTEQFLRSARRR